MTEKNITPPPPKEKAKETFQPIGDLARKLVEGAQK